MHMIRKLIKITIFIMFKNFIYYDKIYNIFK